MTDLGSLLERESLTVEAPDDFERLVRRRDRKRRNRRVGAAVLALVLAALALGGLARAFRGVHHLTPAHRPSIVPVAACPEGSTPDEPGPVDQARPPITGGPMTFDRARHQIVMLTGFGKGNAWIWTFDVCANTWRRMGPAPEGIYGQPALVDDPGSDLILVIEAMSVWYTPPGSGSVWAYDPDTDTWERRGPAPMTVGLGGPQAVYDATTGLWTVRDRDSSRMWTYDAGTDAWREIEQRGTIPLGLGSTGPGRCLAQFLSYDPTVDRLILFLGYCDMGHKGASLGSTATWEFDPRTATWSEQPIVTPVLGYGYLPDARLTYGAYDEANERALVYSPSGTVIAYDATAHRWSRYGPRNTTGPATEDDPRAHATWGGVVYDPVNERLVLYGDYGPRGRDDVWALDLATHRWTQLLTLSACVESSPLADTRLCT